MKIKIAWFAAVAALMCLVLDTAAQTTARPALLEVGSDAPDFTAVRGDNSKVSLSNYRGSYVLVDFWATWCGPCKAAMPHMEKIHQKLKDQGLVVLGVCVWDTRPAFSNWLTNPQVTTSYEKVFDPSTRGRDIARALYKVQGIPTFYLIDRDGRIAFVGVGALRQTELGLDKALRAAGFSL